MNKETTVYYKKLNKEQNLKDNENVDTGYTKNLFVSFNTYFVIMYSLYSRLIEVIILPHVFLRI